MNELIKTGSKWYINFGFTTKEVVVLEVYSNRLVWKSKDYAGITHAESFDEFLSPSRCAIPIGVITTSDVNNTSEAQPKKKNSLWDRLSNFFRFDYDTIT